MDFHGCLGPPPDPGLTIIHHGQLDSKNQTLNTSEHWKQKLLSQAGTQGIPRGRRRDWRDWRHAQDLVIFQCHPGAPLFSRGIRQKWPDSAFSKGSEQKLPDGAFSRGTQQEWPDSGSSRGIERKWLGSAFSRGDPLRKLVFKEFGQEA